ncbi:MAG: hypothetical protein JW855_00535 [Gammaproteobacteria bacterium]|nr:hypothetical protein [Gammaproteobacteria bacterium]
MSPKFQTTAKVVTMLETGVSRETFLERLLRKSKEFTSLVLTCLADRLKLVNLIQNKYTPLERELRRNQASLYDDLVLDRPPETCQASARKIEEVEHKIHQIDVMDKAPVLKNLEKNKDVQVKEAQKIVDPETEQVVNIEQNQLEQVKEEIEGIYEKMAVKEEEE